MRFTAASIFLILFFKSVVCAQVSGTSDIGGLAGAPMRMGFGARGIGLGNAMIAVTNGNLSTHYNPAAAPFQNEPTVSTAYTVLSLDRRLNFFSYGQSLKPSAGASFGIINAGVSNIDGRDRDGVHTQTYSTSENSFFFSFGLKLDPQFSLGLTAKLLYYSLFEGVKSTTAGLDVGILYRMTDELSFGAVLQDINSKYIWDTSKLYGTSGNSTTDNFPLRKRIGLAYSPSELNAMIATELESIGGETFLRVGSEVSISNAFQVRAGLDEICLTSSLDAKPSIGFSFSTEESGWRPEVHYTYLYEPYAPQGIHVISLSVAFE